MKPILLAIMMINWSLMPYQVYAEIDPGLQEQRANCTGPDKMWDEELNSCITTPEAVELKEDAEKCAEAEDPDACYMAEAESKTGVNKGDKYENNNLELVGQVVAGAYALFSLAASIGLGDAATNKSEDLAGSGNGSCTSKKIFQGTSIAWIAGDLFLKHSAKKRFEEMAKKYKSEQGNEELKGAENSTYQSQVRAFTYLREEQEAIKDQAKKRAMLQIAVTVGFAASFGFAIYESLPQNQLTIACRALSAEEKTQVDSFKAAQEAGTSTADMANPANFGSQVIRLGSSAQIAVGAGIMLALNAYLIYHANNEKNRAEENIKNIDEVINTYGQYMAGFCPDGREDLNNERCYCYNEDGSKNDNRTKSVICQNLYAADEINYSLRNTKVADITSGPRQGCITVTGQFDVDCKCRQMINNVTKQNACAKTPNSALISGGFGTQLGATNAVSTLNQFPQGANKALASLNAGALEKQAARQKKLLEGMTKSAQKAGVKVQPPSFFEEPAKKLALKASTSNALANFNKAFAPRASALGATPKGLSNALEKAESKVSLNKPAAAVAVSGTGQVGASKKGNGFKFNWNDSAAREGNKVQTFMDKKYDYKDNDIVKRKGESLFNVISKRYQTSGLRRLFGEEGDDD